MPSDGDRDHGDAQNDRVRWICVGADTPLLEVLERQTESVARGLPAGIVLVVDSQGRLRGTVTDGDVRRAMIAKRSLEITAGEAMSANPIAFPEGTSFRRILERLPEELERRQIQSRRFLGKIVLVDADSRPTRVLDYHQLWEQRVATHRHVAVVGLGYVGLTLALELAEEGFGVTGVDLDSAKIERLRSGRSYVHEPGIQELLREQLGKNLTVQEQLPDGGDVFILAVGTPVSTAGGADEADEADAGGAPLPRLEILRSAVARVGRRLRDGGLVVVRSTVPVGTTREVILPALEEATGLVGGKDFHLAFAPERTIEGRALHELRTLPQIIGGLNRDSVEAAVALFRELTSTIVRVESLEAAELAKLVNNAFRDLSFSFANEIVQLAAPFNLDVHEVIRAANHGYPRDVVPAPSPGVGGPCLTKDPYILSSLACRAGVGETLSVRGRRINESMHEMVAASVVAKLEELGKEVRHCTVLICGLAFKGRPETGDLRGSSSLAIAELLAPEVRRLRGHDAVASDDEIRRCGLAPVKLPDGFRGVDAVLFLNNHRDYERLDVFSMTRALTAPGIVYDGWRLFHPDDVLGACPCVYMGLGFERSSLEEEEKKKEEKT